MLALKHSWLFPDFLWNISSKRKQMAKYSVGQLLCSDTPRGFPNSSCLCTDITTEIATHPSLRSSHFSLPHYQKHYLKPAWLFIALWMHKQKGKKQNNVSCWIGFTDPGHAGYNSNPSFSWWSPSTDDLTLLLLRQPSHPTRQNQVSESHTALLSWSVSRSQITMEYQIIYLLIYWGKTNSLEDRFAEEFSTDLIVSLLMSAKRAETK